MKHIFHLIFLLFCNSVFSQQAANNNSKVDSLEKIINSSNVKDTTWILNLIELSREYINIQSPKIEKSSKEIIEQSKKLGYYFGINKGLRYLSNYYADNGDYKSALNICLERLSLNESKNDIPESIDTYSILIYIYSSIEDYDKAIEYAEIASGRLYKLPKSHEKWYVLMGNIYSSLGNLYNLKNQNDKAIYIYNELLKNITIGLEQNRIIASKANALFAISYCNLSFIYFSKKEYKKCIENAEKSLEISEKHHINLAFPSIYGNLLNCYTTIGDLSEAEKYRKLLHSLYEDNKLNSEEIISYFDNSKDYYLKLKNYEKAFELQTLSISLKDSLKSENVKNELNNLSIKYETEKKDQENKFLNERNNQISKQFKYILFFSSIICIFLLLTLFLYRKLYNAKNIISNTNIKLNQVIDKKDKLFRIISHDLKTPANGFVQLTDTINTMIKNRQYKNLATIGLNAQKLATDLQNIVNNLLYWSMSQQGIINKRVEDVYLEDSFYELNDSYKTYAEMNKINLEFETNDDIVFKANRIHFNTILRNLISNAIKFTSEGGAIKVKGENVNNKVQISIEDSGIGFTEQQIYDFDKGNNIFSSNSYHNSSGTGLGLEICKELAKLYNGQIKIKNSASLGGAQVILSI